MEPLHPCSSSELLEALRETEGARFSEESPDVLGGWGWGSSWGLGAVVRPGAACLGYLRKRK